MAKLDAQWAAAEIGQFLHVTAQINPNQAGSGVYYVGTVMRGPRTEASERAYVIEQILDRVLPAGWINDRPVKDKDWKWLRDQASRGKAALARSEELAQRLGDGAPEMDAASLHPWAWENGLSYWRTGHFHQAVMQAAIRINAETQAKVGRMDVSETKLFNEVFSLEASKPGVSRLRLMQDDGSDTYKSVHRGARALAEGLYAAIRNPGMHRPTGPGEEHLALEQLGAFSILARWIDDAALESSVPAP
jgi:hypothetical protein